MPRMWWRGVAALDANYLLRTRCIKRKRLLHIVLHSKMYCEIYCKMYCKTYHEMCCEMYCKMYCKMESGLWHWFLMSHDQLRVKP